MCNLVFLLVLYNPHCLCIFCLLSICLSENHSQISRAIVAIRVMDINDNAPEFAADYEAFLCENGKPGQVRNEVTHSSHWWSITFVFSLPLFLSLFLSSNAWPQWIIAYLFHRETTEVGVWTFFPTTVLPWHCVCGAKGKWEQSGLIRVDHNSRLSFMSSSRWHSAFPSQKILNKYLAFSFSSVDLIQGTCVHTIGSFTERRRGKKANWRKGKCPVGLEF